METRSRTLAPASYLTALTALIFANQRRLGVVPPGTQLTPWPDELPQWDSLSAVKKKIVIREADVFAAYTIYVDHDKLVDRHCAPDAPGSALLAQAMAKHSLSARAYHRILKVARTIADVAGSETIAAPHVAEAVAYRRFERM